MTPAGREGSVRPAGEAEEARIPPRGKQVPGAEINGLNSKQKTTIFGKSAFKKEGYMQIWFLHVPILNLGGENNEEMVYGFFDNDSRTLFFNCCASR
ncbi:hypothetical protein ABE26_12110 [Cytobacillus firmus]|nr:hypothetical protein [Cytobacillus firmus]